MIKLMSIFHDNTVNILSTALDFKGQGVGSATKDTIHMIKNFLPYEVRLNSKEPCAVIHVHTPNVGFLFNILKNRKESGVVISAHITPDSLKESLILAPLWVRGFQIYLVEFYNLADRIIAVSPEVKKELKRLGVKSRIEVVPNFVSSSIFYPETFERKMKLREKYSIGKDEFVAIGVGQVQPRKGIKEFVETAKFLPDVRFLWIGSMPFGAATQGYKKMKDIMRKHPSNVMFLDYIPREKLRELYVLSDLFFFPSHQETFGLVIVEAAMCGLPLLLKDLTVYRDIFHDAYLKGTAPREYAEVIEKFRRDKEDLMSYRKKAVDLAKNYDERNVAKHLFEVYKKVREEKGV